jgi:hypothetical protein
MVVVFAKTFKFLLKKATLIKITVDVFIDITKNRAKIFIAHRAYLEPLESVVGVQYIL